MCRPFCSSRHCWRTTSPSTDYAVEKDRVGVDVGWRRVDHELVREAARVAAAR